MKWIAPFLLAFSMLAAAAPAAENANDLFQQALVKERSEGNLPEAIKLYQRIVDKYASNRKVAAQALLQLSDCQAKLGDAQSRKSLERLVREFADQKETVAVANRRLAAMGGAKGSTQERTERLVWEVPASFGYSPGGLSPDGRFIAAYDNRRDIITLHDFLTGADRPLMDPPQAGSGEKPGGGLAISPDGKLLAYGWSRNSAFELRTVKLDGTGMRVLAAPKQGRLYPRGWTPDGRQILVTQTQPGAIALVSAIDGAVRVLKAGSPIEAGSFSPDGKHISFIQQTKEGVWQTFVLSADGKSETPLLSGPSTVMGGDWSPDGSRMVFISDRGGSSGIWSVRVMDGKPQGEPELLKANTSDCVPLGFARDGSLFCLASTSSSDIYVASLDPATGRLTSEAKRVNVGSIGNADARVAWLPDGQSLSFWSRRNPRPMFVIHSFATGKEQEFPGFQGPYLGWFPDGHSLMVQQGVGQTDQFRRLDIRTFETQATWTKPKAASPSLTGSSAVSPDLMTLFWARKDEAIPCVNRSCTYVMMAYDLAAGREREVFRSAEGAPSGPKLSPDGRNLACFLRSGEGTSVMVAPMSGGTPRRLYRGAENFILWDSIAWTTDGRHVLVFRSDLGQEELWSFPVDGGEPEKSRLGTGVSRRLTAEVSPDGARIAFLGGRTKQEIWSMTGLFPPAK